jgi:hypothetical protein
MAIRDIMTPTFIKTVYALGVDLTLDDGSPYPDHLFTHAIDAAISFVEAELGIVIDPFKVKGERHDAHIKDREAWYPFYLDQRPLISVDDISITLGNYPLVRMPPEWATIASPQRGEFHLIPTSETLGSFFFRSGIPLIFGDVFSPYSYVPSYFTVNYTAGFLFENGTATIPMGETSVDVQLTSNLAGMKPQIILSNVVANGATGVAVRGTASDGFTISCKTAPTTGDLTVTWDMHTVEPLLLRAIGIIASFIPLNIAGDLIAGAGISQYSIGVDGLSQNVATTASATSAGYGARIIQYRKELGDVMKALRGKYRVPNMFSV